MKWKKLIALLLVMALCLSTAPFSVLADNHVAGEITSAPEDNGTVASEPEETHSQPNEESSVPNVNSGEEDSSRLLPEAEQTQPESSGESSAPPTQSIEEMEGAAVTRIPTLTEVTPYNLRATAQTGTLYTLYNVSFIGGAPGNTTTWGNLTPVASHAMKVGGAYKAAYCLDKHLGYQAGASHTTDGVTMNDISGLKQEVIGFILANGFQWSSANVWNTTDNDRWLVTQLMIWAVMQGHIFIQANHLIGISDCVRQDIVAVSSRVYNANSFVAYYDSLAKKLKDVRKIPSFCTYPLERFGKDELKAQEQNRIKLDNNGTDFRKKITDKNGALANYAAAFTKAGAIPNVKITVSGNSLTASTTDEKTNETALAEYTPQGGTNAVVAWKFAPDPNHYQRFASVGAATTAVKAQLTIGVGNPTPPSPSDTSEIVKISEDDIVSGISFTAFGGGKSYSLTTGLDGTANLSGLPLYEQKEEENPDTHEITLVDDLTKPITYTISENTPIRYVTPSSQSITPARSKESLEFENRLKKWRVTVTKRDAETGAISQGDGTLAGAMYGIYKDGELLDTYLTNLTGSFTTSYYPCGSGYTVQEISPSTGYLVSSAVVSVGMTPGETTIEYNNTSQGVTEQVIKGSVLLVKHNDQGETGVETPEEGAEFQIYLSSAGNYNSAKETERDTLIIDANGIATSKDLPYGTYTVHQTKSWEGREMVTDFQVFISENGKEYGYILNNRIFEALITIMKKDAETGKVIPISGIGFKVRNADTGKYVVQHINYPTPQDISVYYTDVTGKLMMPSKLLAGNYELIEQASAYGYVLDGTPVKFVVDGTAKEVVVEMVNTPQKATLNIYKEGEVFSSVTSRDEGGPYTPEYAVEGLAGAEFSVIAAEDIYTPDGTLRVPMGEQVAALTTDSNGMASSSPLYLGKYMVVETKAPEGYVLNLVSQLVELAYAGQDVDIASSSIKFTNARQKAKIDLIKSMETDEVFSLGTNEEYQNVLFGLFAAEELRAADGKLIPTDGLIETVNIDSNGCGCFTADVPIGSYYVQELATNNHYVISDTKWPVTFEYQGQSTATAYIHVNDYYRITNELIRGTVNGNKADEDGLQLAGALMGLFSPDETQFDEGSALLTATSDLTGSFSFKNVPFGSWIVREIEPPTGFVLSDKSYPVTVAENGQHIAVDVINQFITGSVELEKVDSEFTGQTLAGAEFSVYADSNGNKSFDSPGDVYIGKLTDSDAGIYTMDNLRYGGYFALETAAPEHYNLSSSPLYFEIRENGVKAQLTAKNSAKLGSLRIKKTSEDGKVSGIKFTVTGQPYTGGKYKQEFETDENGEVFIDNLRLGEYTVSEVIDASTMRYVVEEDKTATVSYGKTNQVEFYNALRRSSVAVIKTDAEGNRLTGATFKVYRDTDFNQKFSSETDTFYSDLQTDAGIYWLDGMPSGCYFLHEETAPKGYVADPEYYYFEVDEDTAQIEIANTTDKEAGFVNRPITGSLKIIKTEKGNDTRIKDANFCIKNSDGEVIEEGTTDENGELLFEGLKYGNYTYQEIYAPAGYILDDTERPFTVTKDSEVIEVAVENARTVWYAPLTGDGRINPLYPICAAILSSGVIIFTIWRKRHKKGDKQE